MNCGNKAVHAKHTILFVEDNFECDGVQERAIMMHPSDYRHPNGIFAHATCMNPDCPSFEDDGFTQSEAYAHTRKHGCAMQAAYVAHYAMRAG